MKPWLRWMTICLASLFTIQIAYAAELKPSPQIQASQFEDEDLTSIPRGKGLPVIVRVGLYYQDVSALKENEGLFTATVDVRLRWQDLRLRYDAAETTRGFKEFGGAQADMMLTKIWSPGAVLDNLEGAPAYQTSNLRLFPDGWVELMQRTRGQFKFELDASDFPFDKQTLQVQVLVRQKTTKEAALIFLQQDLDFSGASKAIQISGWDTGLVNLSRTLQQGWYSSYHSGVIGGLDVRRQPGDVITSIFIPLLASMIIPLLAIWMNGTEDGEFTHESAFEFANILIGGLFSVIALNFSISSAYGVVSTGDNLVTRLLALNYVALALSMLILVLLFRLNLPMRFFGKRVQKALFDYLYWALPSLLIAVATAFISLSLV